MTLDRRTLALGGATWMAAAASAKASSKVLRTPDAAFEHLPDYGFVPAYTQLDDPQLGALRLHHLQTGPKRGPPIVLMHGQPTWSYLYRQVASGLAKAGHRVLAPDLVGFGRSDKPAERGAHTYAAHVAWMTRWMAAQKLRDATLVVHDWGGMIGLPILTAHPEWFSRLVVLNTSLPDGSDSLRPGYLEKYRAFRDLILNTPRLRPSLIVAAQTANRPPPEVLAAYDAPYPTDDLTAGPRMLTSLIPMAPDDPGAAQNRVARERLKTWRKPVLLAFSEDSDVIHPGQRALFQGLLAQAPIWRDTVIPASRHFLQEDQPAALVALIDQFVTSTGA